MGSGRLRARRRGWGRGELLWLFWSMLGERRVLGEKTLRKFADPFPLALFLLPILFRTAAQSSRTKIQIAERVFFFVLPSIDPPSTLHNPLASTSTLPAGALSEDSESELSELDSADLLSSPSSSAAGPALHHSPHLRTARSVSRNPLLEGDGDSSSLSELSSSEVELSPLQEPLDEDGLPRVPGFGLGGGMVAGKRLEMMQAVRSGGKGMGGGGKGKAAQQRRGGKGKGKMLPPKKPRRDSWAYSSEEEEDEESTGYSYGGYGGRYNEYDHELEEDEEEDDHHADEDIDMPLSPPKRNVDLKRAVESKRPNFAQSLAMKAPPPGGGKSAGQMANKRRRHEINKIVIKRKNSTPPPPLPTAPGSVPARASKVPSKAPREQHVATKMPKRQRNPHESAPSLGVAAAAFADPSLLPPLPPAGGPSSSATAPASLLPVDGSTSALSPVNLPPLPLPAAPSPSPNGEASTSSAVLSGSKTAGKGPAAKKPRGRPPKNGVCAKRPSKKRVPTPSGGETSILGPPPLPGASESPAGDGSPAIDPLLAGPSGASALPPPPPPLLVYGPHTEAGQPPLAPRAPPYTPAPMPPGVPPTRASEDNLLGRPPYTYASLIAQACMGSPELKMTLSEIYDWINERWPYFKDHQQGWQVRFDSLARSLLSARPRLRRTKADLVHVALFSYRTLFATTSPPFEASSRSTEWKARRAREPFGRSTPLNERVSTATPSARRLFPSPRLLRVQPLRLPPRRLRQRPLLLPRPTARLQRRLRPRPPLRPRNLSQLRLPLLRPPPNLRPLHPSPPLQQPLPPSPSRPLPPLLLPPPSRLPSLSSLARFPTLTFDLRPPPTTAPLPTSSPPLSSRTLPSSCTKGSSSSTRPSSPISPRSSWTTCRSCPLVKRCRSCRRTWCSTSRRR